MTALHRADSLHSQLVRDRDGCCQAGQRDQFEHCWGQLEAAHLIPRRFRHTRWLMSNAVALCSKCHGWFTEHPDAWDRWIRYRCTHATVDALWLAARSPTKPPPAEDAVKRLRQLATQQGVT